MSRAPLHTPSRSRRHLVALAALVLAGGATAAPVGATPVETTAAGPVVGGLLTIVVDRPVPGPQIWTIGVDGTGATPLTSVGTNGSPAFSPDGTRIAFHATRVNSSPGPFSDIYVINADGSNEQRLTSTNDTDIQPTWSPDGTKIAFARYPDGGGDYDIWTMNADGSGAVNITNSPREDIEPDWSSTGVLAFRSDRTGDLEIFTMQADGSGVTNVTNSPVWEEGEPKWSPDGTRLAMAVSAQGSGWRVTVLDVATGVRTGVPGTERGGAVAWSPDQRRLAATVGLMGQLALLDPEGCVAARWIGGMDAIVAGGGSIREPDWQPTTAVPNGAGEFRSLTPARVLDTRTGTGGRLGALGPGESVDVQITGLNGVPADGIDAVALNATVTEPSAPSYLTVWPTGRPRPLASNLNVVAGQTVPNMVVVGVGAGGRVSVYNFSGTAHVVLDVLGVYAAMNGPLGGRFHGMTPERLFDTRDGRGGVPTSPVPSGGTLRVPVACRLGLPSAGLTGVVMNVTVTEPTAAGFLTVYPDDVDRPLASNLNFVPGQTVPNLVVVRVPSNGVIDFYNSAGSTQVLADVVGWFDDDRTTGAGRFVPLEPARLVDTRLGNGSLGPRVTGLLRVSGRGGLPPIGVGSVVLNTTVTETTAAGFLTVFPDDECTVPLASNLNFVPGQTVPNLVVVRISTMTACAVDAGVVDFFNSAGNTHVVVDVFGYYTA